MEKTDKTLKNYPKAVCASYKIKSDHSYTCLFYFTTFSYIELMQIIVFCTEVTVFHFYFG